MMLVNLVSTPTTCVIACQCRGVYMGVLQCVRVLCVLDSIGCLGSYITARLEQQRDAIGKAMDSDTLRGVHNRVSERLAARRSEGSGVLPLASPCHPS